MSIRFPRRSISSTLFALTVAMLAFGCGSNTTRGPGGEGVFLRFAMRLEEASGDILLTVPSLTADTARKVGPAYYVPVPDSDTILFVEQGQLAEFSPTPAPHVTFHRDARNVEAVAGASSGALVLTRGTPHRQLEYLDATLAIVRRVPMPALDAATDIGGMALSPSETHLLVWWYVDGAGGWMLTNVNLADGTSVEIPTVHDAAGNPPSFLDDNSAIMLLDHKTCAIRDVITGDTRTSITADTFAVSGDRRLVYLRRVGDIGTAPEIHRLVKNGAWRFELVNAISGIPAGSVADGRALWAAGDRSLYLIGNRLELAGMSPPSFRATEQVLRVEFTDYRARNVFERTGQDNEGDWREAISGAFIIESRQR